MTTRSGSCLIRAVQENDVDKASDLIATYGLSYCKAWSDGYILLCEALKRNHTTIAKILLKHDSRVNSKEKRRMDTPLHFAVKNKDAEMVAMLLDRKAKVDARNPLGETPLHLSVYPQDNCAAEENLYILRMLLKAGAAINAKDEMGKTALHCACKYYNVKIVDALLEFGADIDCRDSEDSTPLHISTFNGSLRIVCALLKSFADAECKDKNGKTAMLIASEKGWPKIVGELQDYGADVCALCAEGFQPIEYVMEELDNYSEKPAKRHCHFDHNESADDSDHYSNFFDGSFQTNYYDFFRKTFEVMQEYDFKIESLDFHKWAKPSLEEIEFMTANCEDFQVECEREMGLLKREIIAGTNISYYDALTKSIDELAILARNKNIVEALEYARCREKFPLYCKMLYYKFKKGKRREYLLRSSLKSLNFLARFSVPELASLKVLDELTDKELENFVKAVPVMGRRYRCISSAKKKRK